MNDADISRMDNRVRSKARNEVECRRSTVLRYSTSGFDTPSATQPGVVANYKLGRNSVSAHSNWR